MTIQEMTLLLTPAAEMTEADINYFSTTSQLSAK